MVNKLILVFLLCFADYSIAQDGPFLSDEIEEDLSFNEFESENTDTFTDGNNNDLWSEDFDLDDDGPAFGSDEINLLPAQEEPKLDPETKLFTTKRGRYIYHPNQEKGLYKINRNQEYLYKYKKSKFTGFFNLKGGAYDLSGFPNTETDTGASKFERVYGSARLTTLYFEYEWEPLKKMRDLTVIIASGFAYARGRALVGAGGTSSDGIDQTNRPGKEGLNMIMFPISVGAQYKLRFWDNQILFPFIGGAINANIVTESQEGLSFSNPQLAYFFGAHASGGLALNLSWLERQASINLDNDFGINNTYLTFEARQIISFDTDNWDLNGVIFVVGMSFEY